MDALLVALRQAMPGPRTKLWIAAALVLTAALSGSTGAWVHAALGGEPASEQGEASQAEERWDRGLEHDGAVDRAR
jgi:hypothetical protein